MCCFFQDSSVSVSQNVFLGVFFWFQGGGKKAVTRYEKHIRAFKEKKKGSKNQRAVTISIEGRNMSL